MLILYSVALVVNKCLTIKSTCCKNIYYFCLFFLGLVCNSIRVTCDNVSGKLLH